MMKTIGSTARYEKKYETDLLPAGKSHLIADVSPKEIPPGLYDTGNGFYDPEREVAYDYEGKLDVIRTKYPCTCQWLCLMREFRQKHEEKCNTVEVPGPSTKSHKYLTGSFYDGGWQEGYGMHGYGVYTFTNGVIYEGEFFEGTFHGKGELRYQTPAGKAVIRGQWNKGVMTERTILFDGALEYDAVNWQYCKMPDRRFAREYADGVQPGGKSFPTANQPYVEVPEGYIDTGDGFFDLKRRLIYEHEDYTKILRGPALPEQRWILENCRTGKKDMTIGPRQDLYEKYMEPTVLLEPVPPPPVMFMANTRHESTFELGKDAPMFYDASKHGTDARLPERKFKPSHEARL